MSHDALEVVKLRKLFYRDSYRVVLLLLAIACVAIVLLLAALTYEITHRPQPQYFATTSDGKLIPLIPLSQPNLNSQALTQWAATAILSLYTYDFLNFRSSFQDSSQYFTPAGWTAFLNSLNDSKTLQAVQRDKLTVQAVPAGAVVISRQGVGNDGRYFWQIEMPIQVTYESLSGQFSQALTIAVTIERVSTLDSKYGVGISQLVEKPT